MFYDRVKYIALATLLVVGLAGFGIGRWASASNGDQDERKATMNDGDTRLAHRMPHPAAKETEKEDPLDAQKGKEAAKADEARPAVPGRRREAVIRMPSGTFSKEVDAAPYGHGRLTWSYEEDRVVGLIEGSVMGFEFELATEAEISLSSNGTIYGLITGARLTHVRIPDDEKFAELKPFIALAEPVINETLVDLPFSYQFRVQGDRLIISNFHALLAGPNPFGKLQGILALLGAEGLEKELRPLMYFQTLGVAIEGAYVSDDAKEKAPAKTRPLFPKTSGRTGVKKTK